MGLILKGCPFCGGMPSIYGAKMRDYVDGEWAEKEKEVFWIQTHCRIGCIVGSLQARAYGITGGNGFVSPEAAAAHWNRRAGDSTDWDKSEREELEKVIRKLGGMEDEK